MQDQPTIVLVDDDAMWRFLSATALRERGFRVEEFEGAEAMLAGLGGVRPDLVIVDAVMPEVDGFELCRRLRRIPEHLATPVLMMTNLSDEDAISQAYDAGATDFFIKSTHWTLLAERVRYLHRAACLQRELVASHARLAKTHEAARVGTFDFEVATGTFVGSHGSFAILGFEEPRTTLPLASFLSLVVDGERDRVRAKMHDLTVRGQPFEIEFGARTLQGVPLTLRVHAEPKAGSDGKVRSVHGVIRDVTSHLNAEAQIRRLVRLDPLTGLPNRNQFLAALNAAITGPGNESRMVAVVVLDIDRFTQINESLGEPAGDALLTEAGRRLGAAVGLSMDELLFIGDAPRSPDAPLLSRLPGDEFALLLPVVADATQVARTTAAMLDIFVEPFMVGGAECFASACAGIAVYPRDGENAGQLLTRADSAAAEAKTHGRNNVGWYTAAMHAEGRLRIEMLSALHKAQERGELELVYQPVVDTVDAHIVNAEALMRWKHKGHYVSPAEFIPIAEESGLIIAMGEWAIREACRQLGEWRSAGVDVGKISVNIPTTHFERPSLESTLEQVIGQHNFAHGSIELELTETCMVRDFERTLPRLQRLSAMGIDLAIDDFGTGYSSLSYLTRLPLSKLKIDRSFVRLLGVSPQGEAVTRAIVALGQSLGLDVVAEGVETIEQLRALVAIGCRHIQGFLFAKPMPPQTLAQSVDGLRQHVLQVVALAQAPAPVTEDEPAEAEEAAAVAPSAIPRAAQATAAETGRATG